MTRWTPDQERAITAPTGQGNILVSAAAGSGKTAVLVERVMRRVEAGASIDRMLIVTFTNAAAAEMREKIIRRLAQAQKTAQGDRARQLKKQIQLAGAADIMTIDAFCIRVVQNNFHVLGADPNSGIADKPLAEMLAADAMDRVLSRLYKSGDSKVMARLERLTDSYASNRDDEGLSAVVRKIHRFVTAFAEPEEWLDDAVAAYLLPVQKTPYARQLWDNSKAAANCCIRDLDALVTDDKYVKDYAKELGRIAGEIAAAQEWDEVFAVYDTYFKKKRGKRKIISCAQEPPERDEQLLYIRSVFLDRLGSGITMSAAELESGDDLKKLAAEAEDLVWLVKLFMREFAAVKDARGVREFSDVEHMTHDLFKNHSDIRAAYRDKYDEILIDEYQDTNGLQDSIFSMISDNNIFMVGDLKQSIYLFRGGDPYIFKAKSSSYSLESSSDMRLVLAQNFRSRQEVLQSVNDIFGCVMSNEAGDVDYTGDELITRDKEREYYPDTVDSLAELHYIMAPASADSDERAEIELDYTINKIRELLDSRVPVYDTAKDCMRPIEKRDIVILENSTRYNGDLLVTGLARLGIDAYCDTESFFDRREIKTMMSLISALDNTSLDIPLIAVMRSPIFGFTDNELARIRLMSRGGSFISAVRAYASCRGLRLADTRMRGRLMRGATPAPHKRRRLWRKCRQLLGCINRWRGYVRHKSVAQLIWTIYEETAFYDIMGAIERGEEAQFNLRLLYERARLFERAGFRGLFSFIKYIELIEAMNTDMGGAKLVGENHDVVRIMTIHKSKGLEFPYVFMLGGGRQLIGRDKVPAVKLHKELMLGLRDIRADKGYTLDTHWYELISAVNMRETRAESMRLLYVALTRAREKVFVMVTNSEKPETEPEDIILRYTGRLIGRRMLPSRALGAKTFADWLCPAAFSHPESWKFVITRSGAGESEAAADAACESFADSAELRQAVFGLLDYSYPYTKSSTLPSRTSVTQIKELAIERESIYERTEYEPDSRRSSGADDMAELMFSPLHQKPAFMLDEGKKPANEIGTLYHLVMSELDLDRLRHEGAACVEDELSRLVNDGVVATEDIKYIEAEKIKGFFTSAIGLRMLASGEVRREMPFQINITAPEYDPLLPAEYSGETVILQGIIDCYFKEDDGIILFDYKTDKVHGDPNGIRKKYEKQLELYKKAIETLTGSTVTESYLYLFDTGEII